MKNGKTLLILAFFIFSMAGAQVLKPVKWIGKIEKKTGREYLLTFDGTIEKGWHLYSLYTSRGGAAPFKIIFPGNKGAFEPLGNASESKTFTAFNEIFGVNETFYKDKVRIRQVIKIHEGNKPVRVELSFQVCKNLCIQQKNYFEFNPKNLHPKEAGNFPKTRNPQRGKN